MDGAIATALAVSMATAAMRCERVVNFTSLLPFRADLDEFTLPFTRAWENRRRAMPTFRRRDGSPPPQSMRGLEGARDFKVNPGCRGGCHYHPGTHFHGLFMHFPGVGIHFPGLGIHFPGVGIHGVK
jgi:hypothetical protein